MLNTGQNHIGDKPKGHTRPLGFSLSPHPKNGVGEPSVDPSHFLRLPYASTALPTGRPTLLLYHSSVGTPSRGFEIWGFFYKMLYATTLLNSGLVLFFFFFFYYKTTTTGIKTREKRRRKT